jgi:hypothetical protein
MPALSRRPHPERSDCWHAFYGDVHVGTIAVQPGMPSPLPTQLTSGQSKCFCGAPLTIAAVYGHIEQAHMDMAR